MTMHHVKLVFHNDPENRDRGAEVRGGFIAAPNAAVAARRVLEAHKKNSARVPEEIKVARCPDKHVLWTSNTTYMSSASLDRGIGDDFTDFRMEDLNP
jgi:hypothetical protein